MTEYSEVRKKAESVKENSRKLAIVKTEDKNEALLKIADALIERTAEILKANEEDLKAGREHGMNSQLLDRLALSEKRIEGIAEGVRQVAALEDPIGTVLSEVTRPNGLVIRKVSVPLGCIGMIYEARPNVTVDAAVLALKAGSGIVLRGSSSALNSNRKITEVMKDALCGTKIPKECIELIEEKSHDAVNEMMSLTKYIDLIIPRGGASLIQNVVQNSKVPVLETGVGNCHIFIDESCSLEMAESVVLNAKTQRPSVCNATESLLIHRNWLKNFAKLADALTKAGVTIHADEEILALCPGLVLGSEDDWGREYLSLDISAKTVGSTEEAIAHIAKYSTGHTDCILTEDAENAEMFLNEVDSACVNWNASTRFTDGFEFGLGAEIGISTQKMHARGPLGLKEITSYKYTVTGNGQVRK